MTGKATAKLQRIINLLKENKELQEGFENLILYDPLSEFIFYSFWRQDNTLVDMIIYPPSEKFQHAYLELVFRNPYRPSYEIITNEFKIPLIRDGKTRLQLSKISHWFQIIFIIGRGPRTEHYHVDLSFKFSRTPKTWAIIKDEIPEIISETIQETFRLMLQKNHFFY